MKETFKAVFSDNDMPHLTVTDLSRGIVLNRIYFRSDEISMKLTTIRNRLTIKMRNRGYVIAPGCQWTLNDVGGYSVDVVRRDPERYRILLQCGCTVWGHFPPMSTHWSCNDHMRDRQRITSYYDTERHALIETP